MLYPWYGYYGGYSPYYYGGDYPWYTDYGYGYDTQPYYPNNGVISAQPYASEDYATPDYSTAQEASPPADENESYLDSAVASLRSGDYQAAMRMAGHALVDSPQDQAAHQIMELAMFATGDYRGAAMEAHAVVHFGGVPTWANVYDLQQNVDAYTNELRALEQFVRDKPNAAEGQFLLGFHYMITGDKADARDHLATAATAIPSDKIAAQLLQDAGGSPRTARQPTAPISPQ